MAISLGTTYEFDASNINHFDSIALDANYVAGGEALPTTTVLSKIINIGFQYNTANTLNKWQCVAVAQEI